MKYYYILLQLIERKQTEKTESFIQKYNHSFVQNAVLQFPNDATINWLKEIGIETYVGSSGKIFPVKGTKPVEVLNNWLKFLVHKGVQINTEHKLVDFHSQKAFFSTPNGESIVDYDVLIFALGGASWKVTGSTARTFIQLLAPFAPHLAEELWSIQGQHKTITYEPWPEANEDFIKEDSFEYPVSFNGKMRFKIELPLSMNKDEVAKTVLADPRAKKWLETGVLANIIVVPGRIVNIVIKG